MNSNYITNTAKLVEQILRFTAYVRFMDKSADFISFRDSAGILGREEDYKSAIAEVARKELNYVNWKASWIGSGKIADCAKRAISKASNLVNKNQQIDFKNRLDPDHEKYQPEAEQVLYDIYRGNQGEEAEAFERAVKIFGAKYDTIAFLFFIKDDSRFLPISTGHFDKGFSILDIEYITSYRCGWENYVGFIEVIQEVRSVMEQVLPMNGIPRLIDAHSFVWIIQEEKFINWNLDQNKEAQIEQCAEEYIQNIVVGSGGKRSVTQNAFVRSTEVVMATRKRANGVCQYCNKPAPFFDKKGNPYLEVHHVIWLSRGGKDSTDNTVALCPNCHTRMHVLDKAEDVEKLEAVIKQRDENKRNNM